MINKVLKCLSAGLAIGSVVSVICLYFMNGADGTLKQMAAMAYSLGAVWYYLNNL